MEPLITAYIILGCTMIFALLIVVLKIAGKEMFFALARFINPRGCDVLVVDSNRQFTQYYKTPKDGVFTIDGKPYLTNPNKLLNVNSEMVKDVQKSMDMKLQRLNKTIDKLKAKREINFKQIQSLKEEKQSLPILDQLKISYVELDNRIELLESKKVEREQAYFHNRRGLYLYIKDDPIPKDLHEFYTEMDSVQLENVIMRAQTKDPKTAADISKEVAWLKKFILMALIVAALAAWFAFQNHSQLEQIAQHLGVQLAV
jgi:hypothetical protein